MYLYLAIFILVWGSIAFLIGRYTGWRIAGVLVGFIITILGFGFIVPNVEKAKERKALEAARSAGFFTTEEYNKAKILGFNSKSQLDQFEEEQRRNQRETAEEQKRMAIM